MLEEVQRQDSDEDGFLSYEDLRQAADRVDVKCSPSDLNALFEKLDPGRAGRVSVDVITNALQQATDPAQKAQAATSAAQSQGANVDIDEFTRSCLTYFSTAEAAFNMYQVRCELHSTLGFVGSQRCVQQCSHSFDRTLILINS